MLAGRPKAQRIAIKQNWRQRKYHLIKDCRQVKKWKIAWMCRILNIPRSAYYKWLHHTPSPRKVAEQATLEKIQAIASSNNSLFGAGKMTAALNKQAQGHEPKYNHKRIARIMCVYNIHTRRAKYNKHYHWKPSTPETTAENRLSRDFTATAPNQKWCTDITEVTAPGIKQKANLCTVLDLYDRYPVGFAIAKHNDTNLVQKAFDRAVQANPEAHPLFHSDRGFQFTRKVFQNTLKQHGMTQSMSRVHRCIDNGPMEGRQGLIKEMRTVLYPNVTSYDELVTSIEKTIAYYINKDPQDRFHGQTAKEVRLQALKGKAEQYPIAPNRRIERFWEHIKQLKAEARQRKASSVVKR